MLFAGLYLIIFCMGSKRSIH
jgi:hypothetical protein